MFTEKDIKAFFDAASKADNNTLATQLNEHPGLLNIQYGNAQNTALMLACFYGHKDTVALLLAAGADTTIINASDNTALRILKSLSVFPEITDMVERWSARPQALMKITPPAIPDAADVAKDRLEKLKQLRPKKPF